MECQRGVVDAESIRAWIIAEFPGTHAVDASGDTFFPHAPDGHLPERWMPWATLVTSDAHDTASALDRPGVFRLNLGLPKARFAELFPPGRDHDHRALDVVMPHPVYGGQYWVCVLNPDASWPATQGLLREAHALAARRYENAAARRTS